MYACDVYLCVLLYENKKAIINLLELVSDLIGLFGG
jgi:hypothetical protein